MKQLVKDGKLVVIGVIQEQHANRCRLFQQWKKLDFPIVQDALNQNGITVVPFMVAIDETGRVRNIPRQLRSFEKDFVAKDWPATGPALPKMSEEVAGVAYWKTKLDQDDSLQNLIGLADAYYLWKADSVNIRKSIELYQRALKKNSERGDVHFRIGAAYRKLYELEGQKSAELFSKAVSHWETALSLNPNQYIWRRRIQQYGPRLKKPYSFYDWVAQARNEISARGGKPHALPVEPNGAELAQRARRMNVDESAKNPDPQNRITTVDDSFVKAHVNFVPTNPKPGDVVAVHVGLSISDKAKWNHETEPVQLWVGKSEGGAKISSKLIKDQTPYPQPESRTPVSLSFELQIPKEATDEVHVDAFALFNICETADAKCVYRRRNLKITIPIEK